jgi:hypothetical protein
MLNVAFVASLAAGFFALIFWGVRTLPAERWQMLAAVPLSKAADGSWHGWNLTFYGFFSAAGTAFGVAVMLLLMASVGVPVSVSLFFAALVLLACVPASRLIAGMVERRRNTFTVAGAAFVAAILLPLITLALKPLLSRYLYREFAVLPTFAAFSIGYVFGESIGRLACLSFGCCYGMPLRDAGPFIAGIFRKRNLVLHGETKKASYASGLAGEPLIPVQALTSAVFAIAGVAGVALFLAQQFRLAALIPVLASWGWRACAENLRADYRGTSRISAYQVMALIAALYLGVFLLFIPATGTGGAPDISAGLAAVCTVPVVLLLQLLWATLFLYYGRSRVTASTLSFHVVRNRI